MPINFNKKIQTEFDVSPPVLSFRVQPTSETVDYGEEATLNVEAVATNPSTGGDTPSGTISYQWYKVSDADEKNDAIMSGETDTSLSLPAQTTTASYYCEASFTRSPNTSTAINSPLRSNTATISVRNQINITSFLGASGKTITLGESSSYTVIASLTNGDADSLRYEWYVNGDLRGSSSTFDFNPPLAGDYEIFCRIFQGGPASLASPFVESKRVTLKVEAPPPPDQSGSSKQAFPKLSIRNQKSDSDNYRFVSIFPSSEVRPWKDANPAEGVNLDAGRYDKAPTGGGAINFGVGQWEISSIDRDIEVVIELAGAAGQGCRGHDGSSGTPGQGGVGIVYLKMVKGQKYTLQHVGKIGSAKKNNYPDENAPGGGQSGDDADRIVPSVVRDPKTKKPIPHTFDPKGTSGSGGGGTFLYKGGKLIAVAGGGGGSAPGARIVDKNLGIGYRGAQIGGKGGGPGINGEAGGGEDGGTGGTQSQPGDNKKTSLYNKDSADSRGRSRWMLNGVCSSWVRSGIGSTVDGACPCTISNSTQTSIVNGQRTLDDDDPSNKTNESCNTYARSKVYPK